MSWEMILCDEPVAREAFAEGQLSVGSYHCTRFDNQGFDDLHASFFVVALAVIMVLLFWNRMVKFFVRPTPQVVREFYRRQNIRLGAAYETAFVKKKLPAELWTQLTRLFDAALQSQKDDKILATAMSRVARGGPQADISMLVDAVKLATQANSAVTALAARMLRNPQIYTQDLVGAVAGVWLGFSQALALPLTLPDLNPNLKPVIISIPNH